MIVYSDYLQIAIPKLCSACELFQLLIPPQSSYKLQMLKRQIR